VYLLDYKPQGSAIETIHVHYTCDCMSVGKSTVRFKMRLITPWQICLHKTAWGELKHSEQINRE